MAQTASKYTQISSELNDRFQALSEFRLKQIIRECRAGLHSARTNTVEAAGIYQLMGVAYSRLNKPDDALASYMNADKLFTSAACKRNVASALLALDRPAEAIPWLIQALELQQEPFTYGNLAEACMRAGLQDEAIAAFQDAVRVANHSNPYEVLMLAVQAAELGADDDAVELYARSLALLHNIKTGNRAPLDIIREAPESSKSGVHEFRALNTAVMRAEAFGDVVPSFVTAGGPASIAGTGDTDMDTFEATQPYRMRAMAAAIAVDDDA